MSTLENKILSNNYFINIQYIVGIGLKPKASEDSVFNAIYPILFLFEVIIPALPITNLLIEAIESAFGYFLSFSMTRSSALEILLSSVWKSC